MIYKLNVYPHLYIQLNYILNYIYVVIHSEPWLVKNKDSNHNPLELFDSLYSNKQIGIYYKDRYVYIDVCMYVCMYICMYVCMSVCL